MKRTALILSLILLALANLFAHQSDCPELTGPHLGQKPPGMTPEIFAPGILTSGGFGVHSGKFSPDGKYLFFSFNHDIRRVDIQAVERLRPNTCVVSAGPTPNVERMIDVGGRRLHARIYGEGAPAVVLLSGSRAPQTYWDPIVPAIAERTSVVTYDRAGTGKSEMGRLGCDGIQSMKDLKALLESARVPGPWLIVGHSFGGRLARLFAFLFPGDVAGLVLIDTGLWDPRRPIPLSGDGSSPKPPPRNPAPAGVAQTESECNDMTWRQVEAITSYPQVPLTVITAGVLQSPPGLDAEALRKAEERRRLDQEALAGIIPGGRHITLPGIGHDVIHQAPEAVVSAILETIRQIARTPPRPGPPGKAAR